MSGAVPRPLVVQLGGGEPCDVSLLGGKAMGLEQLLAASLPCPPAFCLTTAALERYLEEGGLLERVRVLLGGEHPNGTLRELESLAFAAELPRALAQALADAVRRLCSDLPGPRLLAVRSSAADEDGEAHSFAGLHETALGVLVGGVEAAVRRCWASLWSQASVSYRRQRSLPPAIASMAVVVQVLVPATASAVVFTANPLSGADDELLIHVTGGLGPTLVDNQVTPDTAVLDKRDLALLGLDVGDKHLRIDARPVGGLVTSAVAARASALSEDELRALARLAIAVERELGRPVDIEAALADGRWQLTQARPITTMRRPEAQPGEVLL